LWPTPRAGKTTDEEEESWRARYEDGKVNTPPLGLAVQMWPTPVARDSGGHTITPNYPEGFNTNLVTEVEKDRRRHIPTPTTADVYTGNMKSSQQSDGSMHSVSLPDYVEMFPTPSTMDHIERKGMRPSRAATNRTTGYLSEEVVRWATPTGEDSKNTGNESREKRHGPTLNVQVDKWPTPTGDDANNVTRASGDFQSLSREAQLWPTPATSQDYKPVRPLIPSEAGGTHGTMLVGAVGDVDPELIGGSLNPDWVEQHLMSLPEGWTRLEPVSDGAYDEWFDAMRDGTWWFTERGLPRVTTGVENRVNRLKMLGNGIVPASGALAVRDMMSWCWETIDAGVAQEDAKRRGK